MLIEKQILVYGRFIVQFLGRPNLTALQTVRTATLLFSWRYVAEMDPQ